MIHARLALMCVLAVAGPSAHAAVCRLAVEADDVMQFRQKQLAISQDCSDVEIKLTHVGHQPAAVMGHNWVLVRTADIAAVTIAGQKAGRSLNFQQPGDKRIIAATGIVGGGESATVTFSTANLRAGESYTYFCSSPGHGLAMRGALLFGGADAGHLTAASGSKVAPRADGGRASPGAAAPDGT